MKYLFIFLFCFSAHSECLKHWSFLYQGPGEYFGVQWEAPPLTPLKIIKKRKKWSYVEEFDGMRSWIETHKLSKDHFCGVVKLPTSMKITAPWVKKRDYARIKYGTKVKINKFHKNWVYAEALSGNKFWVRKNKLWVY